jgi:hypothetical protein
MAVAMRPRSAWIVAVTTRRVVARSSASPWFPPRRPVDPGQDERRGVFPGCSERDVSIQRRERLPVLVSRLPSERETGRVLAFSLVLRVHCDHLA